MRKYTFPQIDNLDNELNNIVSYFKYLTGMVVEDLPPAHTVPEYSRFLIKSSDGDLIEYIKIKNEYKRVK